MDKEKLQHLLSAYKRLEKENAYLKQLNARLMHNAGNAEYEPAERTAESLSSEAVKDSECISSYACSKDKITLFRSLFRGRDDVYALRWESKRGHSGYTPACKYEWQRPICLKPEIDCSKCKNRTLLPLTDQTIYGHLSGKQVVGLYPMLKNETCWFLAVDFDKKNWQDDVRAFLQASGQLELPFYVERSRSGNGAHVWLFFSGPVPAKTARRLGTLLLSRALEQRYELGLDSYDRLFPNQDTLPKGGFGNLIALPLQKEARMRGNSVFVDENWIPYPDQWLFLSSLRKINGEELEGLLSGSRQSNQEIKHEAWPKQLNVEFKNGIYLDMASVPSYVMTEIRKIACFSNPEFFRRQARRMTTSGIPRIINCTDEVGNALVIPRGCLEKLKSLAEKHSTALKIEDKRYSGSMIDPVFYGSLTAIQQDALDTLLKNDDGILVAVPGFGKTVVASALIARQKVNTLIIVHRLQLLEQWIEKLSLLLKIPKQEIGQIGGGKDRITGTIDVAMLQSINRSNGIKSFVTQYGQVIVDECHHIAAYSFEQVFQKIRAKYMLGLTATPVRKDGLHPIIEMQCGPIRYKVNAKMQAKVQSFRHLLVPRQTDFTSKTTDAQQLFSELTENEKRNDQLFNDVLQALEEKRKPMLITERVAHADSLRKRLDPFVKNIFVLSGQGRKSERQHELELLSDLPDDQECLVIATGKYIGEGFDDPRLDTLFLAMPISWKGTLEQYVGRLHREHLNKKEVRVYDYVDGKVPMLRKMFQKRLKGYQAMGYIPMDHAADNNEQMRLF